MLTRIADAFIKTLCAVTGKKLLAKEEKKMKRTGVVFIVLVTCLMLVGCFKVKNTDGLRAAYEKIELAYPLVVEIDARQDLQAKDRQDLIDSYNEAKASVNSFLKDVKTKSVKVVDVPKEAFEKDKASQKIDKFISDVKASREGGKAIPAAVVVAIAVPIIEKVWELNDKKEKEAYERFTKIIDENIMVEFPQVPTKLKQ
jgi:hypothetical protein